MGPLPKDETLKGLYYFEQLSLGCVAVETTCLDLANGKIDSLSNPRSDQ